MFDSHFQLTFPLLDGSRAWLTCKFRLTILGPLGLITFCVTLRASHLVSTREILDIALSIIICDHRFYDPCDSCDCISPP